MNDSYGDGVTVLLVIFTPCGILNSVVVVSGVEQQTWSQW